jgi:hypothetical protein
MLFCALVYGQTRPFKGRITDEKGNPIPFATITEVGTNNITTADANGTFTINVNPNARLEIKASGHQPQTLNASGNGINFTLGSAHDEEVVITALGIKREAKATGYAMAALPPSNIIQARPSNIANGFTGKVSGLQVNTVNNGISPATRILLRGERSITGNNQALIVLDNLPVPVDYLNSLNPDDVENISVL